MCSFEGTGHERVAGMVPQKSWHPCMFEFYEYERKERERAFTKIRSRIPGSNKPFQ